MFEIPFATFATTVDPWFGSPGLAGAILGGGIGTLCAIYGTVLGICAPRGAARGFVFALHWGMIALGAVLAIMGIVALSGGQPYGVWYPLLLSGVISALIVGILTPVLRLRYRQAEHRRLEAEEFRRG